MINEESFVWEVGSRNVPPPTNFGRVVVKFKPAVDLERADKKRLNEELFSHAAEIDHGWSENSLVNGPQGLQEDSFPGYPMLEKYVHSLHFMDAALLGVPYADPWIDLDPEGSPYPGRRGAQP